MLFDARDKTMYDVLGSYKTVKNHGIPGKVEQTVFQSYLTCLPNGSYVIHNFTVKSKGTEVSKTSSRRDLKSWFNIYMKCFRSGDGYCQHPVVRNWYYKYADAMQPNQIQTLRQKLEQKQEVGH